MSVDHHRIYYSGQLSLAGARDISKSSMSRASISTFGQ